MKRPALFATSLLTLLSGCGTLFDKQPNDLPAAAKFSSENGIIILSTGAQDACRPSNQILELQIVSDDPSQGAFRLVKTMNIDNPFGRTDFADHFGNLHVVSLKPGRYHLHPYFPGSSQRELSYYNFAVYAGEVVYMGEYWLTRHCMLEANAEFRDQRQRDMALLSRINPSLAQAGIVTSIPGLSGSTKYWWFN